MRTITRFVIALFSVALVASGLRAASSRGQDTTSLVVENRALDGTLVQDDFAAAIGGTIVARYSTYHVIRLAKASLSVANARASAQHVMIRQRDDFDRIYLASRIADTLAEPSPNPGIPDYAPATHGLYVMQFIAPLLPSWKADAESAGARLIGYLPENAFLVDATPEIASVLRNLSSVQWLNPLSQNDKTQEFRNVTTPDADLWVDVADMSGATDAVQTIATKSIGQSTSMREPNRIRVHSKLTLVDAATVLQLPTVIGISLTPHDRLSSERGSLSLTSNVDSQGRPTNPLSYNTWLNSHCVACGSLNAEGFVLGIADSGLDTGDPASVHPDLAGRVTFGGNYAPSGESALLDAAGHGTLLAGHAAGNASTNVTDAGGFLMGMGVAPSAGVFSTKIADVHGQIDSTHNGIYTWASDARILSFPPVYFQNHSHNQYPTGPGQGLVAGQYTSQSRMFDVAVRDADGNSTNDLQPITLTVSAGNLFSEDVSDPGYGQVVPPATAKNVISVGSAEGYFQDPLPNPNDPIQCPPRRAADSFFNTASFSGHGTNVTLVPNGYQTPYQWSTYLKPDLMAPSSVTTSTRSQSQDQTLHFCWDPLPSPSFPPNYAADSGTSFAAPIGEGAALLASRVYSKALGQGPVNPGQASPALLKAMLIGSARTMEGGLDKSYPNTAPYPSIGPRPNKAQGFGRINLEDFFNTTTKQYINQTKTYYAATDAPWNATYYISDPTQPLKVALAWADAPSDAAPTAPPLVNDLDLQVNTPFRLSDVYTFCWRSSPGNNVASGDDSQRLICIGTSYGIGSDYVNNEEIVLAQPWVQTSPKTQGFSRFIVNVRPRAINGRAKPNDIPSVNNQDFAVYVYNGRTRGDIDAEGRTDTVWRNTSTGQLIAWFMNGATWLGSLAYLPSVPIGSLVGGLGDFDHNGSDDVAYQDTNGGVYIVPLNRTASAGSTIYVGTVTDTNWKLRAVGDLDDDDNMDLIFRYEAGGTNQGRVMVWRMNTTIKREETILASALTDLNYALVGAADMDGDGYCDLVWRNTASGANLVWIMNGLTFVTTQTIQPEFDANWRIAALGDYNSDGYNDIVWRNIATGQARIWYMNGGANYTSTAAFTSTPSTSWEIVGSR